jgi:hypothetical protein
MSNTDPGHGNSVASWTTVIIIMVATLLGTWFFWENQPTLVWASGALVVIALIVGWILKAAGYGVGGSKTKGH